MLHKCRIRATEIHEEVFQGLGSAVERDSQATPPHVEYLRLFQARDILTRRRLKQLSVEI